MIVLIVLFLFILLAVFSLKKTKNVLLSFDVEVIDGRETVNEVLDILKEKDVKATFFIMGQYAEQFPEIVERINEEGHEIACHSYSHPRFTRISYDEKKEEIEKCVKVLEDITNKKIEGFRAPYHLIGKETIRILKDFNFSYDASQIQHLSFFKPKIKEIKTSSLLLLPLSDVVNLYYLRMHSKIYFFLLKHKFDETISFNFHPHHIVKYKEGFRGMIEYYKEKKVNFLTHEEFV